MTVLRVIYNNKDFATNAWTGGPYLDGSKTMLSFKNGNGPDIVFAMNVAYEQFCVYCRDPYVDLRQYCKGTTPIKTAELSAITYTRLENESFNAILAEPAMHPALTNVASHINVGKSDMRFWFLEKLKTLLPEG